MNNLILHQTISATVASIKRICDKPALILFFLFSSGQALSQTMVEVTPVTLRRNYSPGMPNYHHYSRETLLCKTDQYSIDEVYSIFISKAKFLAPVEGEPPVSDGGTLLVTISAPGIEFPGYHPIKVVFNRQKRMITNYTLPKHILYPGYVDRQIIQRGDEIILKTEGVGAIDIDKFFVPYLGNCLPALIAANAITIAERTNFGKPIGQVATWLNERQCVVDDIWEPVDRKLVDFLAKPKGLSEGAKLLFAKAAIFSKLKLKDSEKEEIYKKLELQVSKDKKQLHALADGTMESALSPTVRIIDLNGDGSLEVFVNLYNLDWTGQGGQESIFGKNKTGSFAKVFDDQGSSEILSTSANGYPDLLIGGPGMTAPVVRWDGTKYKFYKEVSFAKGAAPKMIPFSVFYKNQKPK